MPQLLKISVVPHLGKWQAGKNAALPDCELIAIVDNQAKTAEGIAQKHGASAFDDYHDVNPLVEAIFPAAATRQHYKIARDFLKAGIHCLGKIPASASRSATFLAGRFARLAYPMPLQRQQTLAHRQLTGFANSGITLDA